MVETFLKIVKVLPRRWTSKPGGGKVAKYNGVAKYLEGFWTNLHLKIASLKLLSMTKRIRDVLWSKKASKVGNVEKLEPNSLQNRRL